MQRILDYGAQRSTCLPMQERMNHRCSRHLTIRKPYQKEKIQARMIMKVLETVWKRDWPFEETSKMRAGPVNRKRSADKADNTRLSITLLVLLRVLSRSIHCPPGNLDCSSEISMGCHPVLSSDCFRSLFSDLRPQISDLIGITPRSHLSQVRHTPHQVSTYHSHSLLFTASFAWTSPMNYVELF